MELIKTWRKAGFTLRIWDTFTRDWRGQTKLAYELKDGRKVIFSGDDISPSSMYAIDSLDTVSAMLGFLTLKPSDTDREYFSKYTSEQMAWCESARCDELSMIQFEMEENLHRVMARYQQQRLADWLKNPGANAHTPIMEFAPRVGIHDSRAIEHIRTYLWDLADYRVESVQAGVIWLAPKPEVSK